MSALIGVSMVPVNATGHPNPKYRITTRYGVLAGYVTRWARAEPKTGRWVNRGTTLRTYWRAEDAGGGTIGDFRTRTEAATVLVAKHEPQGQGTAGPTS